VARVDIARSRLTRSRYAGRRNQDDDQTRRGHALTGPRSKPCTDRTDHPHSVSDRNIIRPNSAAYTKIPRYPAAVRYSRRGSNIAVAIRTMDISR